MKNFKGTFLLQYKKQLRFLGNLITFSFFVLVSLQLSAQSAIAVHGTVSSEGGTKLSGATVSLKGSSQKTMSNSSGYYSLDVPSIGSVLQISYAGMQTAELIVENRGEINVVLKLAEQRLDSVVVVGYGTQRRTNVTGAVASISSKDLQNRPNANIQNALQGKIAGVQVTQTSGEPGNPAVIRIRGIGTINNNDPLFVVDGMQAANTLNINPENIERIEVLKDASSAAIYGSRGSNGVILITTKRGISGKPQVAISSSVGFEEAIKKPDLMNSSELYQFLTEAYTNAGITLPEKITEQYNKGYNTDWFKESTRKGLLQNHNISVRGGTEGYRYALGAGYFNENGYIKTLDYSKVNLSFNNDITINPALKIGNSLNIAYDERRPAPFLPSIYEADPFTPVINPASDPSDPEYEFNKYAPTEYSYYSNPSALLAMNFRKIKTSYLTGNIFAEQKILKHFTFRSQFGIDKSTAKDQNFYPSYLLKLSSSNLNANVQYRNAADRQVEQAANDFFSYVWNNTIRYDNKFGNHSISVLAGTEIDSRKYVNSYSSVKGIPGNDEAFRVLSAGTANYNASGSQSKQVINSYIGRINYDFKGKYLLTANFRADGSSNFAPGKKWGYFPAISAGWKISEEGFFKEIKPSSISYLKLRASWGQNGNQNIPSGAYASLISPYGRYPFGGSLQQAYSISTVGNPDIQWEKGEQTDIGADVNFLNNRLSLSFDWYEKKTRGMILQVPLPYSSGYPSTPYVNAGDMKNTGVELSLTYSKRTGELKYDVTLNFDKFTNKVISLGNGNASFFNNYGTSKTEVGQAAGSFYGAVFEGIFQSQAEIDGYVNKSGDKLQPNAKPGDMKFKDVDGDGAITGSDQTIIGNPYPKFSYSLTGNASFKEFDLSVFFQGISGNKVWAIWQQELNQPVIANGLAEAFTNAWRGPGTSNYYPRLAISNANDNYRKSSWYVHDGSYLRLKNVQLGYTFSERTFKFLHQSSCRIYVSATNLFTVSSYLGLDPEQGDADPKNFGIDYVTTRIPKSFTVGVNIQF